MVTVAVPQFSFQQQRGDPFFDLFPHRFDYIFAPHPDVKTTPNWQTESRHPLTDRMLSQGRYLYGVRFGAKTQYCLIDIDAGSAYHPQADAFAIQRLLAALEPIGLVAYLACTSSYSSGLHLYFPFSSPQSSWEVGAVVTTLLENAGFVVKPGQLEIFPNRKNYSIHGKPSLFNAHRLPLQMGSYLLNQAFEPIWSDRHTFVQQWQLIQNRNEITTAALRRILKQSQQYHRQLSGKAAKFINDLNAEIELGWTDHGQTNYLLGRITMRAYIFHHVLEGTAPLKGQALVDQIVATAKSLPGYREWCQHQHEIEHRASEWARCVESSHYFHYGDSKKDVSISIEELSSLKTLNWNQQQSQNTREKIKQAIADLLNQNALPAQATARFKLLINYGIGGGSLYRHKDLWHPEFIGLDESKNELTTEDLDRSRTSDKAANGSLNRILNLNLNTDLENTDLETFNSSSNQPSSTRNQLNSFTSLLPTLAGNLAPDQSFSGSQQKDFQQIAGNVAFKAAFADLQFRRDIQNDFEINLGVNFGTDPQVRRLLDLESRTILDSEVEEYLPFAIQFESNLCLLNAGLSCEEPFFKPP